MASIQGVPPHQPADERQRSRSAGLPSHAERLRARYGWTPRDRSATHAVGTIGPIDDDDDEDDDQMGDMSFAELCLLLFVVFVICLGAVFVVVSPIIMILVAWWALFG